jgi:hypothetical protein
VRAQPAGARITVGPDMTDVCGCFIVGIPNYSLHHGFSRRDLMAATDEREAQHIPLVMWMGFYDHEAGRSDLAAARSVVTGAAPARAPPSSAATAIRAYPPTQTSSRWLRPTGSTYLARPSRKAPGREIEETMPKPIVYPCSQQFGNAPNRCTKRYSRAGPGP